MVDRTAIRLVPLGQVAKVAAGFIWRDRYGNHSKAFDSVREARADLARATRNYRLK